MNRMPSGPVFNMGGSQCRKEKIIQMLDKTDIAYTDDKPGTFLRGENKTDDSISIFTSGKRLLMAILFF